MFSVQATNDDVTKRETPFSNILMSFGFNMNLASRAVSTSRSYISSRNDHLRASFRDSRTPFPGSVEIRLQVPDSDRVESDSSGRRPQRMSGPSDVWVVLALDEIQFSYTDVQVYGEADNKDKDVQIGLKPASMGRLFQLFQGRIAGISGSSVAATLHKDGALSARMMWPGGRQLFVEPIDRVDRVSSADFIPHIMYSDEALTYDSNNTCMTKQAPQTNHSSTTAPSAPPDVNRPLEVSEHKLKRLNGAPRSGIDALHTNTSAASAAKYRAPGSDATLQQAQLAIDIDYEFFKHRGSNVADVEAAVTTVVNALNVQYQRDVGIVHDISVLRVRTSAASQPYRSSVPDDLLSSLVSTWSNESDDTPRDIVQLFTGKEVHGNVIGYAYVGAICSRKYGVGFVQSDFNGVGGSLAAKTDLSAHELGHSWSAKHCSCTSHTMNPYITGANAFHPTYTVPNIVSHRDSRTCLKTVTPMISGGGSETGSNTEPGGTATPPTSDPNEDSNDNKAPTRKQIDVKIAKCKRRSKSCIICNPSSLRCEEFRMKCIREIRFKRRMEGDWRFC